VQRAAVEGLPYVMQTEMSSTLTSEKRIELARVLWGWAPHPTQKEWLLDRHQVKVAACGRRWGKTEAAAVDVATYAIANNGSVQMIVAPTYDQSKLITNTVERLLLSNPAIRAHVQITRTPYPDLRYLKSRIMARTADDDGRNLRGHSADRVVVDEAAFVRDEVVEEVIGPMLADRNGELVMISTPFGKNHFYRAFVRGLGEAGVMECWSSGVLVPGSAPVLQHSSTPSLRHRSFRFTSRANPYISREYVEYQRSILSDRQFKVEYEAEFIDDQSSVFPWEDIQAGISGVGCSALGVRDPQHPTPSTEHGITVAGIDWARYSDYTAVVVLGMRESATVNGHWSKNGRSASSSTIDHQPSTIHCPNPQSAIRNPKYEVLALDRFNRMEWRALVERVADLLCSFRVCAVLADQTSAGDPALEMLRSVLWSERGLDVDIEGMVFTNQSKRELIDNLAIRLAHREVTFPHIEPLIQELQFYEYELTESGNVRTGARRGYHDDCVIALALALRIAPRYIYSAGFSTSGRLRESARGW